MILEHVDFKIPTGKNAEFEEALQLANANFLSKSKGFLGYQLYNGIESPDRYLLTLRWGTLENHTVDFRGSELHQQWRAIVSPYFATKPVAEHFNLKAGSA